MFGRPADRTVARMTTASETTLGRLGAWAADHRRLIVIVWAAAVLALGALAPFADRVLSGAGWEAPASESGEARRAIESSFPGRERMRCRWSWPASAPRSMSARCAPRSPKCSACFAASGP